MRKGSYSYSLLASILLKESLSLTALLNLLLRVVDDWFLMENRDRPSFDGSGDDVGRDSSGGEERKAPARTRAADDLKDDKIGKDDDFAEEFPPELPRMPPYASLPSATASTSRPILNDNDDRDIAFGDGGVRLANAPLVEPMRPPGRLLAGSLERPPVVAVNNHEASPGAFPVRSSRNIATSRTPSVPIGLYDSSRGFNNEESKQEEVLSDSAGADASTPRGDLHAVEAQLVPVETMMVAEAQHVRMKWYQRPLYRWISVGSILCACSLFGVVIVLVVVLSRQPAAASSSSVLPSTPPPTMWAPPTPAPTTAPPSPAPWSATITEPPVVPPTPAPITEPPVALLTPAPTTGAPPTLAPNTGAPPTLVPTYLTPEQIACNFLSLPDVNFCRLITSSSRATTGSKIPSEIGLLTRLEVLSFLSMQLSGSIPSEIGLLTQLNFFTVDYNQLKSRIPSEIGLLTKLKWLSLDNNQFTGAIPSEIGLLS